MRERAYIASPTNATPGREGDKMLREWLRALGEFGRGTRKVFVRFVDYLLHWPRWLFALLFIIFMVLVIVGAIPPLLPED